MLYEQKGVSRLPHTVLSEGFYVILFLFFYDAFLVERTSAHISFAKFYEKKYLSI